MSDRAAEEPLVTDWGGADLPFAAPAEESPATVAQGPAEPADTVQGDAAPADALHGFAEPADGPPGDRPADPAPDLPPEAADTVRVLSMRAPLPAADPTESAPEPAATDGPAPEAAAPDPAAMPPAPPAIPAGDIFAALGIAPPPAAAPLAPAQLVQGLFGKLPVHGDFIQRGLPRSFRDVWDHWLTRGISAARQELGPRFDAAWNNAPAWRFALPAGACGPDPVAGVMVTSSDTVGRQFPLAAVALQPGMTEAIWAPEWFAALEGVVLAGRAGLLDADAMAAALPRPGPVTDPALAPPPGWWTAASATRPGLIWPLPALPAPEEFALLLESEG